MLAANGNEVFARPLCVQSVRAEYTFKSDAAATTTADSCGPTRVNKLLNYVHSMCERFPVDDCVRMALQNTPCRTVPLQCITGT